MSQAAVAVRWCSEASFHSAAVLKNEMKCGIWFSCVRHHRLMKSEEPEKVMKVTDE